MTTYLGKSCSFYLPRVPFVNCRQSSYFPFGFEGRIWDLIVSVPYHCLSFYLAWGETLIILVIYFMYPVNPFIAHSGISQLREFP